MQRVQATGFGCVEGWPIAAIAGCLPTFLSATYFEPQVQEYSHGPSKRIDQAGYLKRDPELTTPCKTRQPHGPELVQSWQEVEETNLDKDSHSYNPTPYELLGCFVKAAKLVFPDREPCFATSGTSWGCGSKKDVIESKELWFPVRTSRLPAQI